MPRRAALAIAFSVVALSRPLAAQQPLDWTKLKEETTQVLADYIRVNTTNPPGNELEAAMFLKRICDREGIENQVLDTVAFRGRHGANFYARIRGNGSKKAIALVHHMDVVPAAPAYWSVDPFAGTIKDGYLYGRGSIDMKDQGVAHLMAMIALKRSGVPLTRDIVFIGNADEELNSTGGLEFVKSHADLLKDVEFLMTEGADNQVDASGKVAWYSVGVAEKRTFWQKLSVKGTPSHGSRPTKLNPVPKLVAALDRIAKWETPLHVTPGVDKYFRDISVTYPGEQRRWLSNVSVAVKNAKAREWITSNVYWNSILRNSISLTALQGSNKTNVIPPEATAELDIRLLPDTDVPTFLAQLQKVAGDTAVHFETLLQPKTPLESPVNTDLFRAIERAARDRDPGVMVTTPMLTAATDRPTYRRLGIVTYGFDPFKVPPAESQRGMHGNDERISLDNLGFGVKFLYDVLRYAQ